MRISDWSSDVCSSDLFGWGWASVRSKLHHGGVAEPHPHPGPPLEGEGEKPRKVRPPRCVIHLETGNPHNILETARRLCIWDNPPLAIIIAKLPRNGFTPPRDNPERSEERRVGKECVSTCRSRGS